MDDNDESTDTPTLAATFLAAFDIRNDERITNVCPWDNVSGGNGESNFGRNNKDPEHLKTITIIDEILTDGVILHDDGSSTR